MASSSVGGFLLLLVAVVSVSHVIVPGALAGGCSCPPLWTAFGDNCYRFFSTKNITWFDAEMVCRGFSVPCGDADTSDVILGHLTSVHSQEEMDFLSVLFDSVRNKWVPTISYWVWIGLHDKVSETEFMWSDGSAVDHTYWAPGQPASGSSGASSDCVLFRPNDEFKWHDIRCSWATQPSAFICKLPKW